MKSPPSCLAVRIAVAAACAALCVPVDAQIFTEDFESFSAPAGNFNGAPSGQTGTGLDLAFGGSLSGWSKTGGGSVHVVDSANLWSSGGPGSVRNYAAMLWEDNILTQQAAIAGSNDLGTAYVIDFLAAPAVYESPSQATGGTDGIRIEVLRASDNVVLHDFVHQPGAFVGNPGNLGLMLGSFGYTGDGSGDIRFRIGPSAPNSGRFGGAIDDLALSVAGPVFEGYTTSPAAYVAGQTIEANLPLNVGGVASAFSIVPPLPAGLVLNPATGSITGTPAGPSPQTEYTVTASFPDAEDQAAMLDLSVLAGSTLTGYTSSPAIYVAGMAIAANMPEVIGATPEGFAVSPALPAGLQLDPVTGNIVGTPASAAAATDYLVTATFASEPDSIFALRIEVIEFSTTLMISEFMASNGTTVSDGNGNASDWIEIHNFGDVAVDLRDWYLTDSADDLSKWRFPAVVVPAGAYLVVYASDQSSADYVDAGGSLHTSFSLSAAGEFLGLVEPDGVTVAHAFAPAFPPQVRDISYGVSADLTTIGFFDVPTPGSANPGSPSEAGPLISDVTDSPLPTPGDGDDITVSAQIDAFANPVASVTLHYRVMFGGEQSLPMNPLGDGRFSATIPGGVADPGEMVRWYVTAEDSAGQSRREPPYLDPTNSPQYFGTMIADPSAASPMRMLSWFVASPGAASTRTGTRSSVYFSGQFYDNVFTRVRGASSTTWAKKAYKLDFNTGHHFRYDDGARRVEEINLNTTQQDKSYVRESLSYETYRAAGVAASDAFPVHIEQNGQFFSVASLVQQVDSDFLSARGLDPGGALYKMNNGITTTSGAEKKTRHDEGNGDLQELIAGLSVANPNRNAYLFDHVDLPAAINYFTCAVVCQDFDRFAKNYYLYRDSDGSGEWTQLPWDKDLTFGERFVSDEISGDGFSDEAPNDPTSRAHPFWCASGHERFGINMMVDAVIDSPVAREMYLRRLRTLMDELLQPPGTPPDQLKFEARLDELFTELQIDAAKDLAKWGSSIIPSQPAAQDLATAMNLFKTSYLAERRAYLYDQHGLGSAGDGIQSTLVSGVPGVTAARYSVPADDSLGLSWTAKDFDDSGWHPGATGVGFETFPSTYDALISTAVRPSDIHADSTSVFLRIRFDIADVATVDALELRMKYDDGFVAYLNGTEIARRNVGGAAGTVVGFDTRATSHPDANALVFEAIDVGAFAGALVQGENVLAIQGLNSSVLNSDMLVLPELIEAPRPASPGSVGIPGPQPGGLLLAIDAVEFNPASGDQDEEFVAIVNPNAFAVDVSGWTVEGAIEHVFKPGTVIPSAATAVPLYLSPNVSAFRARGTAPNGNAENFVQGNYRGQLSARGETITIRDNDGNVAASVTYSGAPSQAQQYLRITELHYHPAGLSADESAAGFSGAGDFEFIELKNIGPTAIDIGGVRLESAVDFIVPPGTMLAAGAHAVVVSNQSAFEHRYGSDINVIGQYSDRLSNDGERILLRDAVGENILKFTFNDRWYPATDGDGYALVILNETADWSRWDLAGSWGIGEPLHGSPGVQNGAVILQQYEGWLNRHFSESEIGDPLLSGPDADANGDGQSNFYHYAFGTNPRSAGAVATGLPSVEVVPAGLELTYRFRDPALDLEFVIEVSSDLRSWSVVAAELVESVKDGEATTATVRVPHPSGETGDWGFVRVRASP